VSSISTELTARAAPTPARLINAAHHQGFNRRLPASCGAVSFATFSEHRISFRLVATEPWLARFAGHDFWIE
jgi:hypothetical protein